MVSFRHCLICAAVVLAPTSTSAADYVCASMTSLRRAPDGSFAALPLAPKAMLHVHIAPNDPVRSTIRWSGDPNLEGEASAFGPSSTVISHDGAVFGSIAKSANGMNAVGTLVIDQQGALWITESTIVSSQVIHDIVQGQCSPKPSEAPRD